MTCIFCDFIRKSQGISHGFELRELSERQSFTKSVPKSATSRFLFSQSPGPGRISVSLVRERNLRHSQDQQSWSALIHALQLGEEEMLVLSRKTGERISIGDEIQVVVLEVSRGRV